MVVVAEDPHHLILAESVVSASQEEKLENVPGWDDPNTIHDSLTPSQQRIRASSQPLGLWTLCCSDDDGHGNQRAQTADDVEEEEEEAEEEDDLDREEEEEEDDGEDGGLCDFELRRTGLQGPLEFASPDTQMEKETDSYNPCFESDRSRSVPPSPGNSFKVWNASFSELFGAKMVTQSQMDIGGLVEGQPPSPLQDVSHIGAKLGVHHGDSERASFRGGKSKESPAQDVRTQERSPSFSIRDLVMDKPAVKVSDSKVDLRTRASIVPKVRPASVSEKANPDLVLDFPGNVVDDDRAPLIGNREESGKNSCKQVSNKKRKSLEVPESVMDVVMHYSGSLPLCKPEDPDFLSLVMSTGVSLPLPFRDCRGRVIDQKSVC